MKHDPIHSDRAQLESTVAAPCKNAATAVVVVTPIKNEGLILERFLSCCSTFADRIILLDQQSTDNTFQIVQRFPKAELHENPNSSYDESFRQRHLFSLARQNNFKQLIILALDADEILTSNVLVSPEWQTIFRAAPGTVIFMPRLEMLPLHRKVLVHDRWAFGYVDDGIEHFGSRFHSTRVPLPSHRREIATNCLRVLHYSFDRAKLQEAKNRFYCIKENLSGSRSLMERRRLYRYNFIENRKATMICEEFDDRWTSGYEALGIDMHSVVSEEPNWLDVELEKEIALAGGFRFHFDPVWNRTYDALGSNKLPISRPPRGLGAILAAIDYIYDRYKIKPLVRWIVNLIFWLYIRLRQL